MTSKSKLPFDDKRDRLPSENTKAKTTESLADQLAERTGLKSRHTTPVKSWPGGGDIKKK